MKFYASSLTPLGKVLISSRRRWNNVKLILLMKHLLCFFVQHTHLPCSFVVFIEYLRVVKQSMHSLMCMTVKLVHYIFHLVLFLIVFLILLLLFLVLVLFILEVILFVILFLLLFIIVLVSNILIWLIFFWIIFLVILFLLVIIVSIPPPSTLPRVRSKSCSFHYTFLGQDFFFIKLVSFESYFSYKILYYFI